MPAPQVVGPRPKQRYFVHLLGPFLVLCLAGVVMLLGLTYDLGFTELSFDSGKSDLSLMFGTQADRQGLSPRPSATLLTWCAKHPPLSAPTGHRERCLALIMRVCLGFI